MTTTSLMPTMLSVPPYWGAPVPGFSPCQPGASACVVCPELLVDDVQAAARRVRATAPTMAPYARGRKCLTWPSSVERQTRPHPAIWEQGRAQTHAIWEGLRA